MDSPALLLGPRNRLGLEALKGQARVDSWGMWEIGAPRALPHSLPRINASPPVNLLQTGHEHEVQVLPLYPAIQVTF